MIRYELEDVFKTKLDEKVLSYVEKLGHPDKITFDKSIGSGHYLANLYYNTQTYKKYRVVFDFIKDGLPPITGHLIIEIADDNNLLMDKIQEKLKSLGIADGYHGILSISELKENHG